LQARRAFCELGSKTAKTEAVKEHIRIRVPGFGWEDLHHPWSERGVEYTPEQLLDHLIQTIISEESPWKSGIPSVPVVDLPSRGERKRLGTMSLDVVDLQKKKNEQKQAVRVGGEALREKLETNGVTDSYEKRQGARPDIDDNFVGTKIEQSCGSAHRGIAL